jgi:flagellin
MSSFSVVTNITSLEAQIQLGNTQTSLQKTITQLTSGLRINSAADDAAGLAVANRDQLDDTGLQAGIRSATDAVSTLQAEDGAMSNIASLLNRAMTLATQAASGTFQGDRNTLNAEFGSVLAEITRTATAVGLGTSGSALSSQQIWIGNTQTNTGASVSYITVNLSSAGAVDASGLSISTSAVDTQANAASAISSIQSAMTALGKSQGAVGAAMNRLQFAVSQAQTLDVSVQANRSSIMDANIAQAAANLSKYQILQQSGIAALAQANASPQAILQLLH